MNSEKENTQAQKRKRPQQSTQQNKNQAGEESIGPNPRKIRKLDYQDLALDGLPLSQSYQISFMHRDVISQIVACPVNDLLITGSIDGHIKFWKKTFNLIDPIRTFKAHSGQITGTSLSKNQDLFATVGIDKIVRIFDTKACDLKQSIKLHFVPVCCQFIPPRDEYDDLLLAIGQQKSGRIMLIDYSNNEQIPLEAQQQNILIGQQRLQHQTSTHQQKTALKKQQSQQQHPYVKEILNIHKHPIKFIKMNWKYNLCVSIDERAFLQVWDPLTFDFPKTVKYRFKLETQFLELIKLNSIPIACNISPQGTYVAIMFKDKTIKVYNVITGKCILNINESIKQVTKIQEDAHHPCHSLYVFDNDTFEKRIALQKDIEISKQFLYIPSLDFDQTQTYLIYSSIVGVVIYSIPNKRPQKIIGKRQNQRFLKCIVYQGRVMRNPAGSSTNQGQRRASDPLIVCSSFKRPRFYLFSRRQPEYQDNNPIGFRDVINQRTNKQQNHLQIQTKPSQTVGHQVVLQTTHGDIYLYLYTDDCPKTCQNFTKLVKKGYYNGMIFHRVIKNFMIQTGCPNGDGTGGQSIWGGNFQDQLMPEKYRFEKPYCVAMANRGPNTNGSQFFITVVPCPWLDNKHTIFGRVYKGIQAVCDINKIKTDKTDKPLINIKIMSAKVL